MVYLKLLLVILASSAAICTASSDWSYDGHNGPEDWPKKFPICGNNRQSPIDIIPEDARFYKRRLRDNYIGVHPGLKFSLQNNGHSAQVTLENTKGLYLQDTRRGKFAPVQVHFHWGSSDKVGSEHTVNGMPYPAEMHFVHMNTKYASVDEAVKHWDGLLVLGTFIEVDDENEDLDPIFSKLDKVQNQGQKVAISDLDISKLMSDNTDDFYFYLGSLTTPKCNQAVKWYVFKEPISISEEQMNLLRNLKYNGDDGKMKSLVNNFRPTQPLNRRRLYRSFKEDEDDK